MLLGVMSDTHGRVDTTEAAMKLFRERKVGQIIHCGDVGSEQVLNMLAQIPAAVVWGNTDGDLYGLERAALALGVRVYGAMGRLTLDGTVISFLHGDDTRQMRSIQLAQDCDLLLSGHTHSRMTKDIGRIRLVNPGALHRANPKTVAVIDLPSRDVEFLEVGE